MVIAFNSISRLRLVRGPQAAERAREGERGKVICIAREIQPYRVPPRVQLTDETDYEPPRGA